MTKQLETLISSAKEVGNRVALIDLVEDYEKVNVLIDKADLENKLKQSKYVHKISYAARTGTRMLLRTIGNINGILAGWYVSTVTDSDSLGLIAGLTTASTLYLLDYLAYDKANILNPYKTK